MPRKTTHRASGKNSARRGTHLLSKLTGICFIVLVGYVWIRLAVPPTDLGSPSPTLPLWQAYWLRARLARNLDILTSELGSTTATEDFYVDPGEPASTVSLRLAERNIVPDARLLRDYLVYKGLDSQVEAGFFQFRPGMNTIEVATTLTDAMPSKVGFHMWAGWRLEQVAAALSQHPHLSVDSNIFHALATRELPLPGDYSFLAYIPEDSTLEGFMYPGDYLLPPRATAPEVLSQMLSAFEAQAAHVRHLADQQHLSLYQLVTLASIVQRETIRQSEAPLIAGVFLNRLALGMPLAADPTVQYIIATPADWWPQLSIDPRLVQSPLNTYLNLGLPPGPIANPGLNALQSVGNPISTEFLYFRAACDDSGRHNFSRTYREHLLWDCGG